MMQVLTVGLLALLLIVGAGVYPSSSVESLDPTKRHLLQTVVTVQGSHGSGTGMVVDDDLVITACHVLGDDILNDPVIFKPNVAGLRSKGLPAVTLFRDVRRDVCLLHAPDLARAPDFRNVKIATRAPKEGERLIGVNVKDFQVGYSIGSVVRLKDVDAGNCTDMKREHRPPRDRKGTCIITDGFSEPGWSGGGLFRESGQLVGMIVGGSAIPRLVAVPSKWLAQMRKALALGRIRLISRWSSCATFDCASRDIQAVLDTLPSRSRETAEVLAQWAKVLATHGEFVKAVDFATDLPTGLRITASIDIATAYADSGHRQPAEKMLRELVSFAETVRRRQSVRVSELVAIGTAQARIGFLEEAERTFLIALEAADSIEGRMLPKVEGLIEVATNASKARLFGLADLAFQRALIRTPRIKRDHIRIAVAQEIEEQMFISRLVRADEHRDDEAQSPLIIQRLAEIKRFADEWRIIPQDVIDRTTQIAKTFHRQGDTATAENLFQALIAATGPTIQERKAIALSTIAQALIDIDPDLAKNLYLQARSALGEITEFYDDLESTRAKAGEAQVSRRTSWDVDRGRFMVVEGLSRIGHFEEAYQVASDIDVFAVRQNAYHLVAKDLVKSGFREHAQRVATNIMDDAMFASVFIENVARYE